MWLAMKLDFAANKFKPISARLLYYPSQARHNTFDPRSNLLWAGSPVVVAETPKNMLLLARLFVALSFGGEACRMLPDGVFHSQLRLACINMSVSHAQFGKVVRAGIHVASHLGSD